MTIGERIKEIRKSKKISVDTIASQLGISKTTIYRYEDSTIEKIPLQVIEKLAEILGVSLAELTGNGAEKKDSSELPVAFDNAQDLLSKLQHWQRLADMIQRA